MLFFLYIHKKCRKALSRLNKIDLFFRVRKSKENSHVQKAFRLCENRRIRLKNPENSSKHNIFKKQKNKSYFRKLCALQSIYIFFYIKKT